MRERVSTDQYGWPMTRGKSDTCLGERFFSRGRDCSSHTTHGRPTVESAAFLCVVRCFRRSTCAWARQLRSPHRRVYGVLSLYTSSISQRFNMSESLTTQVIRQPSNTLTYGA